MHQEALACTVTRPRSPPRQARLQPPRPGQQPPQSDRGPQGTADVNRAPARSTRTWKERKQREASAWDTRRPGDVKEFEAQFLELLQQQGAAAAAELAAVQARLDDAPPQPVSSACSCAEAPCWHPTGISLNAAYHGDNVAGFVQLRSSSAPAASRSHTPAPMPPIAHPRRHSASPRLCP